MAARYSIFLRPGIIGAYGVDTQGKPWVSFEIVHGTVACGACAREIRKGWVRGKYGEEQLHVCSGHVRLYVAEQGCFAT